MSETEQMSVNERRKYLHKMRIRYWQAETKSERGRLLGEMERVTNLHRKSLIRLIKGELARKPRRHQRGKTYGIDVADVAKKIAHSLDYPCAERLQPNLVWMAKHLEQHGEIKPSAEVYEKLGKISVPTLRRLLPPSERVTTRMAHRRGKPKDSFAQRQLIPMCRLAWDTKEPGHFETDLVHHCGISASGQYVHTLQMLDVATGWSECVAILGRSYLVMQAGFERIEGRLPFPIIELHPDNGSEFLNAYLLRFWKERTQPLDLSRSRPYHKNDNRFVEENNYSLVRAYIGYNRLDTIAHINLLNCLYDKLWLYHNFFQPVMRLAEKRIEGQHRKRIYDQSLPPFDRLCKLKTLPPEQKTQLDALRNSTNPCTLRTEIENLIDQLHASPCALPGQVDDVHLTLPSIDNLKLATYL